MCNELGAGMNRSRGAALAIIVIMACAPIARATTLARMTLGQLASAAQAVAQVRCTGVASRREAGSIWTFTDFTVEETFKGAPSANITIRLPGGRDGHIEETVEGAPRFAPGDEAIVFLERTGMGDWSISAWAEGTFRIARESQSGPATVTQDSSGMPVFDAVTRTFRSDGIARMPLGEFRARLHGAIASGGR
jgi:hypothetical protein